MARIVTTLLADERTYQLEFYKTIVGDNVEVTIDRNTDGRTSGMIFEHKQNLTNYGKAKALSQALIYLCRFNRDGIPIPSKIMLVSQNEEVAYLYKTENYIDIINDIPKYALLPASLGIPGFTTEEEPTVFHYSLSNIAKSIPLSTEIERSALYPEYVKVSISEHNVYGWSQFFYSHAQKKRAKKSVFFEEIKEPENELKEFVSPWTGEEVDFSLIMDLLNDPLQQKKLGAFYTPPLYASKSIELVREAIKQIPPGNDYIILDRCAGTGALEAELNEEELSHVIVNTYELKEWHALKDRLGGLVRCVLPPIPKKDNTYPSYDESGCLNGANALEKSFINRKAIMKYVNNPSCNVILFENPPYSDDAADTPITGESRNNTSDSYMAKVMNKEFKSDFRGLVLSKEIDNLFIWSGFKYYLKKPNDAYILYSPIKYWKTGHLVNKRFVKGFFFNRKHFHAGDSAISCIYWQNEDVDDLKQIVLEAYDISEDKIIRIKNILVSKVYKSVSETLFDKIDFEDDHQEGIYCQRNGLEGQRTNSTGTKNYFNESIIGWLHLVGFSFDSKNIDLVRTTLNLRKNGFYITKENFVKKLPLFCAKAYPQNHWYETDVYSTTGDLGNQFETDSEFLKKCLIYSCLTQKNKCRSLNGSDGRLYLNELCFEDGTCASNALQEMINNNILLSERETTLINDYKRILAEIKKCDAENNKQLYEEYNPQFKYGIFQIDDEINVTIVVGHDANGKEKTGHKYGDLNNMLTKFKKDVQQYYDSNIAYDLFAYELLK